MRRRVMFIVLPIVLVLALLASPALAKGPEQGLLWETIAGLQEGLTALAEQLNDGLESLQEQIDGIQAYLANFTEEDPVFSAMDTEADLETQIGDNVLTVGENISLLNNDAGYVTQALQVGNIKEERVEESVDASLTIWERISFIYELPEGAVPICANGEAWVSWCDPFTGCGDYRLDADDYIIYPSFYEEGEVLFRCYYYVDPFQWPLGDKVEFDFYYSYIEP